jgi:hypothetical protein
MTYTLTSPTLATNGQTVIRDADGANIPPDPRNADFQAYLAWLGAGNTPAPYAPPAATQAQLAAALEGAASAACAAIVAQVFPDAAHQAAFQNAAALVNSNGGAAPVSGPLATKFAALASVYGLSASAFAALIVVMQGASLDLSAALGTLVTAAQPATTAAQLATALAAFETALATVVSEINAGSPPTPIVAPAVITIAGINA